ncbi:hypothetical protein DCE79_10395 [Lysinibacillus sp. 2017]|uniref:hypothetical protein n=1 Tax=unclassified Lysinibacillus TaxID=2636778 RepID=UPI000D52A253|nr:MULTISPECIES: hypothetical protein [unclassified Lysinibacillus]AWE07769.1 hypothetical protein DCE79_10395 [Lysinibacillus sp. 2017]TGN34588.1 hypothetical protein E4L99_13755 [Lysinibacillus sp. S2017]
MKKRLLSVLLAFCSVTLIACQSQNEEITLLDNVSDISISKSNGYGGLNENYILSINREEAISGFKEVLKKAKGKNQDVDVINEKPDYDILIRYENGDTHGLHLLLGNAGDESVITYTGHEKYGYIVSPEDTNELRKLLDAQ